MDILTTIAEYKKHLQAVGYAAATIDSYRKNLDLFRRYLENTRITDFRKVNHQTILDYQSLVMAQPVAMETKALKIRPVKRLFEHLIATHKLLVNPCDGIVETRRKYRKIGPVLNMEEVQQLMQQPDLSHNVGIRDRAVMEVLYATAIRLDELLALDVHHVDLVDKTLFVRKAKGGHQRALPLGKTAAKHLKMYIKKVRPHYARHNRKERRLWLNHHGRALSKESVRGALRTYRLAADITRPVTPHTFRRSCATHLLQQGVDIRYIQKLLGHRSLKTTQVYTKVLPVEVKQTHKRTHPGVQIQTPKPKK